MTSTPQTPTPTPAPEPQAKHASTVATIDWGKVFTEKGHVWGDNPSPTALLLAKRLRPHSSIFEYGYGYGRDVLEFIHRGHRVQGIEKAAEGLSEAMRQLSKVLNGRNATLSVGDFEQTILPKSRFDAVSSHRMLHLLGNNGLVRAFEESANHVLRPGGLLAVSARNMNDFKEEDMIRHSDDLFEYKSRPGHLISPWTHERFKREFGENFDIIDLIDTQEIESVGSAKMTNITIMYAKKKTGRSNTPS